MRSKVRLVVTVGIILVIVVAAALYRFALPGLSSARPAPPKVEIAVATWLLRHSVPDAARKQRNPLGADLADVAAGRDLFRGNCEIAMATTAAAEARSAPASIRVPRLFAR